MSRRVLCLNGMSFLLALSVSAQSPAPADTFQVTLLSAVSRSVDVSPEVAEVDARRDFAVARSRLARASRLLPKFEVTTAHAVVPGVTNPNGVDAERLYLDPDARNDWDNWSVFTQAEAELLQPILAWGQVGATIAAAQQGVSVEEAGVERKRQQVSLRTASLYYDVKLAEALVRVADNAIGVVERAKVEIERLLSEGADDVDEADRYQVLITEQELRRRVVEAHEKRATARAAMRRQLFLPDGSVLVTTATQLEPLSFDVDGLSEYQEAAMTLRPELAQVQSGIDARRALVRVQRSDLYPKLFLGARYGVRGAPGRNRQPNPYHSDPFIGSSVEAGLGFRLNLNFAQTRAKVAQAEAEQRQVESKADGLRQLILFEVEKAYRDLQIAQEAVAAQEEALRLSKEWLRSEEVNFDLELGDTENLIKAVEANLMLQASRHEAVHGHNLAVLKLLDATGTLSTAIGSGTLVD